MKNFSIFLSLFLSNKNHYLPYDIEILHIRILKLIFSLLL